MLKTLVWSVLFCFSTCMAVQGETLNTDNNASDSDSCTLGCSTIGTSKTGDNAWQQEVEPVKISQTRIRERYRDNDLKKVYLGGTVGLFLPSDSDEINFDNDDFDLDTIDSDSGFGGSAYAGYKLNQFLSADLEIFVFGGDAEPFDSDYTAAGFFLNPRYTLPIGGNANASPYGFISPGIGVAGVGFGDDIEDRLDDDGFNTGVAVQLKAGAGLPLSETIDVFGQARYFNAFNVYQISGVDEDDEDQGFSSVSFEAGLNFKL